MNIMRRIPQVIREHCALCCLCVTGGTLLCTLLLVHDRWCAHVAMKTASVLTLCRRCHCMWPLHNALLQVKGPQPGYPATKHGLAILLYQTVYYVHFQSTVK